MELMVTMWNFSMSMEFPLKM